MEGGALTDAFQVVFHPLEQILTPIPTGHVLNGLASVSRFLVVVFAPLVGIVVFPLAEHPADLVACIDVGLVPMGSRRATKDLMRVNIPILHALNPVDAAVVGAEGFVDVAALVVIVVHVGVKLTETVACWTSKEAFENITAHVVQVIAVVVENGPPVVGVHHLASCLGAAVFVQQRTQCGRTRNGNDGLQVFTPLSGGLPSRRPFVGFAVNGHVAVAPVLRAEPFHRFVNALTLSVTSVVETACALFGGKHSDLRQRIAVRNKVVVDEFPASRTHHVGWT